MGLIYVLGIKLAFILRIFAYRKKIIDNNLKNAFPKKENSALKKIKNQFYSYFGQLIVESIKLFNCSEDTIRKRHKFVNESLINTFLKQDKDVIIVLGHYCNWEWALLASSLNFDAEMIGIYKPLSSKFWNEQILNIRSQFGATLVSMKESFRYLLKTIQFNIIRASRASEAKSMTNEKQEARFALHTLQFDSRMAGYKHPDSVHGEVQNPVTVLNDDGTEEPKGKTYPKLIKVADSQDANSLLINIGKFNVSGSDYRIKRVQIIRSFLEWGVSKESGYLLPSASWTPPAKGNIKNYKGKPPASLKKKKEAPIYPIQEGELFELINYIDNLPEGAREDQKARAKEWSFPINLLALYGLRPIEIFHLSIKNDGKEIKIITY